MNFSFKQKHLFCILNQFREQHLPLDLFLHTYFRTHRGIGSKERRYIAENVYGIIRWYFLLEHLAGSDISWEKKYILFKKLPSTCSLPPYLRVSFPQDLFQLLVEDYPKEQALSLCQISNSPPPITIRINSLKTTRTQLMQRWKNLSPLPCSLSAEGIQFKTRIPLTSLEEFKKGFFEIQDEGSQLIAYLVEAKPGDQVLDYCAGAGGKTLAFAPRMKNSGQIYLHDIRPFILKKARHRLRRSGIQNAQFLPPHHLQMSKLCRKMDWVLADVPCSGTGTLRRNPDQKLRFSLTFLEKLIFQQRHIFQQALSYVRPGGKIVYATCSLLKKENENQVDYFLKNHPLKLSKPPLHLLPSSEKHDGFFAATFTFLR